MKRVELESAKMRINCDASLEESTSQSANCAGSYGRCQLAVLARHYTVGCDTAVIAAFGSQQQELTAVKCVCWCEQTQHRWRSRGAQDGAYAAHKTLPARNNARAARSVLVYVFEHV